MSSDFSERWRPSLQAPVASPAPPQTQARVNYIEGIDAWGVTTIVDRLAPSRPVVAITLGPEDESGGVLLTGSDLPSRGWRLGVRTPFAGVVGGEPIKVQPISPVALTPPSGVTASLYDVRRDLCMWHVMPAQFPGRVELRKSGTLSVGAATASDAVACVIGRKRVRIVLATPSVEVSVKIFGEVIGPGGQVVSVCFYEDSGQTLQSTYGWSPQNPPVATTVEAASKGIYAPDFVRIRLAGAGAAATMAYTITAEDE